ncbi:hypothetical protein [Labrenzia sp. VG12]|uniref:hypothetical protein n=1 Tax=Labrenzia sp. VG12 TaxID=2021862 RepID=UPI000B8C5452|nr:hypothetical protein [Labrenzia sp. VG12]ASP36207.1 hypothetical protein CHH27_25585 [Labrenzia sp. VG12]
MKSVLIAMHLVACEPDLLICRDISSTLSRWSDIAACRQDQAIRIAEAERALPERIVVMSRCRYLIGRDQRSAPMF